jgi:hypothetical protein
MSKPPLPAGGCTQVRQRRLGSGRFCGPAADWLRFGLSADQLSRNLLYLYLAVAIAVAPSGGMLVLV